MLPTEDQKRLKLDSKIKKGRRAYPLKVVGETAGIIGFIALPLAFFISPAFLVALPLALFARWRLLIAAASIYGPHLGEAPGRSRMGTADDMKGMRRR